MDVFLSASGRCTSLSWVVHKRAARSSECAPSRSPLNLVRRAQPQAVRLCCSRSGGMRKCGPGFWTAMWRVRGAKTDGHFIAQYAFLLR